MVIVVVIVVDNRCLMINVGHTWLWDDMTMPACRHEVTLGDKYPEIKRQVHCDMDIQSGHQGSPSVVATSGTPVNPAGPPGIVRDPGPSQIIVVKPSSVVERSPTPVEIRDPCIPEFSHYPPTVGVVRMKITCYGWNPDRTVAGVTGPPTVRGK